MVEADGASTDDFGVSADAGLVALELFEVEGVASSGGGEDLGIEGEGAMGESGHDTARARDDDADADFGSDGDFAADPVIFGEGGGALGIDDDVGAEALNGEIAFGVSFGQGAEGGGAEDVDAGVIEEVASCGGRGDEGEIGAEGLAELFGGLRRILGVAKLEIAVGVEAGVPEQHVREAAGGDDFVAGSIEEGEGAVAVEATGNNGGGLERLTAEGFDGVAPQFAHLVISH